MSLHLLEEATLCPYHVIATYQQCHFSELVVIEE